MLKIKVLHTYIINSYFIGVKQTVSTKNSNGQNVWANLTSHSSNPNELIDNELSKILQEIVFCQQNFLLDRQKTNHSNYSSVSSILVTILISTIQIPPNLQPHPTLQPNPRSWASILCCHNCITT